MRIFRPVYFKVISKRIIKNLLLLKKVNYTLFHHAVIYRNATHLFLTT